jgi:hypothetical protein
MEKFVATNGIVTPRLIRPRKESHKEVPLKTKVISKQSKAEVHQPKAKTEKTENKAERRTLRSSTKTISKNFIIPNCYEIIQ